MLNKIKSFHFREEVKKIGPKVRQHFYWDLVVPPCTMIDQELLLPKKCMRKANSLSCGQTGRITLLVPYWTPLWKNLDDLAVIRAVLHNLCESWGKTLPELVSWDERKVSSVNKSSWLSLLVFKMLLCRSLFSLMKKRYKFKCTKK